MIEPPIVETLSDLLRTEPSALHRAGETVADVLNAHLGDISNAAERIADALEAILDRMPR